MVQIGRRVREHEPVGFGSLGGIGAGFHKDVPTRLSEQMRAEGRRAAVVCLVTPALFSLDWAHLFFRRKYRGFSQEFIPHSPSSSMCPHHMLT